ncbi:rhomboid family intramembrane serine protease [Ochrobactrum sp. WV_118_8]|uniref:rhomboid family intramembrane serine protease n=1 Tax=Brucella anthropi TaxID=529 RepID=UPI0021587A0F|nr:rhomboid family intramembrane serine protease [Brucella anthropi]MCR8494091.1 rhomboid family intramembrane serine protease [Brucella anthropi]UVV70660.1 rhomboid family intramembrane serine protease [Brucella anthropi]
MLRADVPGGPAGRDGAHRVHTVVLRSAGNRVRPNLVLHAARTGLLLIGCPGIGRDAWWAHIGGFVAGWLITPLLRRPSAAYRQYYRDEGVYGFLPDGRRKGEQGPWT